MLRILCAFVLVIALASYGCSDDDDVMQPDAGQDAALVEAGVDGMTDASSDAATDGLTSMDTGTSDTVMVTDVTPEATVTDGSGE